MTSIDLKIMQIFQQNMSLFPNAVHLKVADMFCRNLDENTKRRIANATIYYDIVVEILMDSAAECDDISDEVAYRKELSDRVNERLDDINYISALIAKKR